MVGVGGLAGTPQGIAQRAKKENWQRRRVAGVKGNVFEYYVGDMPESVRNALDFKPRILKESSSKLKDIDVCTSELEASMKTVVNQMEAMFDYL
ncbi:DNA-binding protein [Muribacter muris]|uniref:DNA-binding protein n=1 Tax=Muribacter muris TaxID=67855 RepID=UPI00069FBDA6|nr:DNA-binding protein [Muribacter muris]